MTREQLERLADLSEADIYEAALANPRIAQAVAAKDSRVILQEKLYGDPISRKRMQEDSKRLFPNANIAEIDLPKLIRDELKPDLDAIKELRGSLETDAKGRRHAAFRSKLQEFGAEEQDLPALETFMVDNEFGTTELAMNSAVEKFYAAKELAEPRGSSFADGFAGDSTDGDYMKALLASGPADDLDKLTIPYAEKVFEEMFGSKPGRGRR